MFLAYVLSISAATQVLWPLFLLITYFFTCSFYPWFAALAVMYLNFPSVLTVLVSGGNALQFLFQWFVDFLEKLNFEFDTTEEISNEHAAARNLSNFHDARIVGSTVTQPIISRDAGQQLTEPTDHQLVIPPPDERITDTERSEAPVLYEYFSGIRIIRPPFTRETHRTEARLQLTESWEQLTEATDHQIMRFPRTSSRINGRDAVLLNTSSEDQTEPSDSQLVMSSLDTDYQSFLSTSLEERLQPTHHQLIRSPESRIPGRVEAYFRLSRSEEDSTEHLYHSELREQNQLTSREIESIPSTSRTYYTYPSQQSHSEDSIQHVPMLSYISKLFERSNGSADINQNYTKYQEIRQTVPKQIHISQTEQPYFTVHKELKEVSKRKGKVTIEQLRDTSKEKRAMEVSESTVGTSFFGKLCKKLGYCGHCGLYDYLPFRQDFTQLREPYQTRSGYIYGPIRRFLKLPEFLKIYNRR